MQWFGTPVPGLPEPKTYSTPRKHTIYLYVGWCSHAKHKKYTTSNATTNRNPTRYLPRGDTNDSKHASRQRTNLRCTQEQSKIAEVNLTPGDNNTTEQSNKYSSDMLVDTTDHPIMKDDVKHMSIQAQEILPTTVPDKRENNIVGRNVNHTNTGMKTELTGRRHYSPSLMTKYSYQHRRRARNGAKNHEQKENFRHIVNEHEAKRTRQRHRNYNPQVTTTISTIHDSRIQSSYAK
jgi:hypothetical protein